MNKIGKGSMYMIGAGMIAALSYYMGMPKSKKAKVKDSMGKIMKTEKDMLEDFCN